MKNNIIFSLLILMFFTSCEKEDSEQPPWTVNIEVVNDRGEAVNNTVLQLLGSDYGFMTARTIFNRRITLTDTNRRTITIPFDSELDDLEITRLSPELAGVENLGVCEPGGNIGVQLGSPGTVQDVQLILNTNENWEFRFALWTDTEMVTNRSFKIVGYNVAADTTEVVNEIVNVGDKHTARVEIPCDQMVDYFRFLPIDTLATSQFTVEGCNRYQSGGFWAPDMCPSYISLFRVLLRYNE